MRSGEAKTMVKTTFEVDLEKLKLGYETGNPL